EFLSQFNKDIIDFNLGRKVAVIGGGNSSMDSARAATKIKGVEKVYIIYRRTEEFMPADREEFDNALADGVVFRELLSPVEFFQNGILRCQKMQLGEIDSSGRRRPMPVENEFEEIQVDSVISAIGERVDSDNLLKNGVLLNSNGKIKVIPGTNETSIRNVFIGGDALRGPSTVIESIADGSKVANVIISRENICLERNLSLLDQEGSEKIITRVTMKKGVIQPVEKQILKSSEIEREANRCLECNLICNRCVEVCPNRANIAVKMKHDLFRDIYQIIHIDGLCNECGNCETFCPYQGAPYKDKLTLFWNEEDFNNSENNGFILENDSGEPEFRLRLSSEIYSVRYNKNGKILSEIKSEDHDELLKVANIICVVYKDYKYIL
ncbi:MAG: FAD-dependent oxidoreductase, partial [Candidatus Marinimicrobia bacterium]|nr:FAD-dependent oxidoreductase [Candidatus Neomarinimicrobiota bacterium]